MSQSIIHLIIFFSDVKTVLEAGKLEQKRQRVNEQIKRRQEKETAETEERERLKQYKPIVLEITPSTTHPKVGQVGSQKNTGKPLVEKQKRIARQVVHQHVRPHRPQDIYKKIWNMRDKTAL